MLLLEFFLSLRCGLEAKLKASLASYLMLEVRMQQRRMRNYFVWAVGA